MNLIQWLMDGDVSIQYQVKRDLLGHDDINLRKRIEYEGFGKRLLEKQQPDGHWVEDTIIINGLTLIILY